MNVGSIRNLPFRHQHLPSYFWLWNSLHRRRWCHIQQLPRRDPDCFRMKGLKTHRTCKTGRLADQPRCEGEEKLGKMCFRLDSKRCKKDLLQIKIRTWRQILVAPQWLPSTLRQCFRRRQTSWRGYVPRGRIRPFPIHTLATIACASRRGSLLRCKYQSNFRRTKRHCPWGHHHIPGHCDRNQSILVPTSSSGCQCPDSALPMTMNTNDKK